MGEPVPSLGHVFVNGQLMQPDKSRSTIVPLAYVPLGHRLLQPVKFVSTCPPFSILLYWPGRHVKVTVAPLLKICKPLLDAVFPLNWHLSSVRTVPPKLTYIPPPDCDKKCHVQGTLINHICFRFICMFLSKTYRACTI